MHDQGTGTVEARLDRLEWADETKSGLNERNCEIAAIRDDREAIVQEFFELLMGCNTVDETSHLAASAVVWFDDARKEALAALCVA